DWVLIPESPPDLDNWELKMVERLRAGRSTGRRDSIVMLAEGARDREGNIIGSSYVQQVLEEHLKEEVRVTVLGHVQRGGAPSAFDRNLGTLLGHATVNHILESKPEDEPQVIGLRGNRITMSPLMDCVEKTLSVGQAIEDHQYARAMQIRGSNFIESFDTFRTLIRALPHAVTPGQKRMRIAVMNAGSPAAGMNTGIRAAVRLGIDAGHILFGIQNGFQGLIDGEIQELHWMSVNGWTTMGGSELGTNRKVPEGTDFYAIARNIEKYGIEGLLIIGGWTAYVSAFALLEERKHFPAFNLPVMLLPASINNNLPGSDFSIGADTALNNIVEAVDKIKQSAVASKRCFVVEVMGGFCGYLALMSGMATGAERVYINEEGVTLKDLVDDVETLNSDFSEGKRLGLIIRNEKANHVYSTPFMSALFEEEGQGLFDVRAAILGHLQQGGDPTPFDRIQATRFAKRSIELLADQIQQKSNKSMFMGLQGKEIVFHDLQDFPRMVDMEHFRPWVQWWMENRDIVQLLARKS
ncbi:MAG: 6-phosphofructokinase, partial [Anaerolineales bacterium]